MAENKKEKKSFKLPHLFWIMVILLLLASALTYIIPAGQFARDADGNVLGNQFNFLPEKTPVSIAKMFSLVLEGLQSSSGVIFVVMCFSASMMVLLDTGAIDNILNWATYKLKDKGMTILIVILFFLIGYIGGLAGSDALVALVPVGVLFAKKLNLDNIVAVGVTTLPAMIGFSMGPSTGWIPQAMVDVPMYSGFGVRILLMAIFLSVGLFYLLRYVNKIQENPENSVMYSAGWRPVSDEDADLEEHKLDLRSVFAFSVYLLQYIVIILYSMNGGDNLFNFMIVISFISSALIGLIMGMSFDDIGNSIAKGINAMGFVGVVIGLAGVFSLVLKEGNIIDTIVYFMSKPLQNVDKGFAAIGIMIIVALINPIIPSATSKAAILFPIIRPITEALGIEPQIAVLAFQFGAGFTLLISPVLGWTVGSLETAKVDFARWTKWVIPIVLILLALACVALYVLSAVGWSGY